MFGEKVDVVREFAPDEITGIAVTVVSANVCVYGGEPSGTVKFHYHGWSLAKPNPFVGLADGTATFTDTSKTQDLGNLKLDVFVPAGFVKPVSIRTASGNVTVDDLECAAFSGVASSGNLTAKRLRVGGDLSLETTSGNCVAGTIEASRVAFSSKSGNLTADFLRADAVSFASASGNRTIRRLVAGKLDSTSTSGNLTVDDCSIADLRADSTSGSITLNLSAFDRSRVAARSATGSITVAVPRSAGFSLEAKTDTGSISSDIPEIREKVSGAKQVSARISSGEGLIDLTSRNGSLKVLGR